MRRSSTLDWLSPQSVPFLTENMPFGGRHGGQQGDGIDRNAREWGMQTETREKDAKKAGTVLKRGGVGNCREGSAWKGTSL